MRNTTWRTSSGSGRRRSLLVCGIVISLTTLSAAADQTEDLARLRGEAAQLRQGLERLEARIQAIENQNRNPAAGKDARQPEGVRRKFGRRSGSRRPSGETAEPYFASCLKYRTTCQIWSSRRAWKSGMLVPGEPFLTIQNS